MRCKGGLFTCSLPLNLLFLILTTRISGELVQVPFRLQMMTWLVLLPRYHSASRLQGFRQVSLALMMCNISMLLGPGETEISICAPHQKARTKHH